MDMWPTHARTHVLFEGSFFLPAGALEASVPRYSPAVAVVQAASLARSFRAGGERSRGQQSSGSESGYLLLVAVGPALHHWAGEVADSGGSAGVALQVEEPGVVAQPAAFREREGVAQRG